MYQPPAPDDLTDTFATKPKMTDHGTGVLEKAFKKVGAKVNPVCPNYNADADEVHIKARIETLKEVSEEKFQGTTTLFGVRIAPDFCAEVYARLMLAMGGEHVKVVLGRQSPFMRKAACAMWVERLGGKTTWPGFKRDQDANGVDQTDEWHQEQLVTFMTNVFRQLHPERNTSSYNVHRGPNKEKREKAIADDQKQKAEAAKAFAPKPSPAPLAAGGEGQVLGDFGEHELDDAFDPFLCAVCHRIMTLPFTLACQHSFCQDCVAEPDDADDDSVANPIPLGSVMCPMCREVHRRPVSKNITLNTLCIAARARSLQVPSMVVPKDVAPPTRPTAKPDPKAPRAKRIKTLVLKAPAKGDGMVPAELAGIAGRVRQRANKRTRA